MSIMKKLQLLIDKRQPFFIPYHFLNSLFLKRKIKNVNIPNKIHILMTYDVENVWGLEDKDCQKDNIEFLKKIQGLIPANGTYFFPGNLITPLAKSLQDIEKENEIGLHGHHHELWRDAYFVYKGPIRDDEKKKLISDSLTEFDRNGLKRPVSFRAPYMWCKKADLKLLKTMDFTVDSSDNPQNGVSFARNSGPMMRIPVTTNPFPYYKKRNGLLYAKFHLLNMRLLHDFNEHELYQCLNQILKMQAYLKQIPHLVLLIHSWEFYESDEEKYGDSYNHCGEKNYRILKEKLGMLEDKYSVEYITLSEFKNLFEKQKMNNFVFH